MLILNILFQKSLGWYILAKIDVGRNTVDVRGPTIDVGELTIYLGRPTVDVGRATVHVGPIFDVRELMLMWGGQQTVDVVV